MAPYLHQFSAVVQKHQSIKSIIFNVQLVLFGAKRCRFDAQDWLLLKVLKLIYNTFNFLPKNLNKT